MVCVRSVVDTSKIQQNKNLQPHEARNYFFIAFILTHIDTNLLSNSKNVMVTKNMIDF